MTKQETVHRYITVEQVNDLRDAAHSLDRATSLRDEVIVVLLADLGLRVSELVKLKKSMFHLDEEEVVLPSRIQKDYPNEQSPSTATLQLDPYGHFGTVRLLRTYFRSDWFENNTNDEEYLFPSRQSPQMTTESVRNVLTKLAVEGEVRPRRTDGEPAEPDEMHPHAIRHSLASYMLKDEDTRLVDVRNRLRHTFTQTTERIYEHFQRR